MKSNLKRELVDFHSRRYEDVLIHTNMIHTNVLKGGSTDATL